MKQDMRWMNIICMLLIFTMGSFGMIVLRTMDSFDVDRLNEDSNYYAKQNNVDVTQRYDYIKEDLPPVGRLNDLSSGSHGSAFIVGPHTIITNYHVVRKDLDLNHLTFTPHKQVAQFKDGKYVPEDKTEITDYQKIKDVDLVVLHTKKDLSKYGAYHLTNDTPKKYDVVKTAGYPHIKSKQDTFDSHMIESTYRFLGDHYNEFYVKGVIYPGASGSPMINKKGDVFGVCSFRRGMNEKESVSGGVLFNKSIIDQIKQNTY